MISAELVKLYKVKKGKKVLHVELLRTEDGRMYVVPIYRLSHVYEDKEGKEKEWNYDDSKAEEIDYYALPANIRKALSIADIF